MEGLKTYLYISKSKIDLLYDQIVDQETTTTKEIGIDIKLLKASLKSEVAKRDSLTSKLNAIVTYIRHNGDIGSVEDPSEYFEGTLKLKFGAMQDEMVLWGNEVGDTILGLTGSAWHLMGIRPAEQTGYGGTWGPVVYDQLKSAAKGRETSTSSLSREAIAGLLGNGLSRMLENFHTELNVEFLARKFDRFSHGGKSILIGSPLYVALAE